MTSQLRNRTASLLFGLALISPVLAQEKPPGRGAPMHLGVGVIESLDAKAHVLTISHQPMPTLGMQAMTMDFKVATNVSLRGIKPGDTIAFLLGRDGKTDGVAIVTLQKVETSPRR